MKGLIIEKAKTLKEKPDMTKLGFGKYFTDHMFIMDYNANEGWHNKRIVPFGPITIHPASTVLHYGAEIFEGMKAYKTNDGYSLFRPYENAKRFNNSAERMCLPQVDEELFVEAVKELINVDYSWIPTSVGSSLYIRPFMFGNDETLGVHSVKNSTFIIILSPVGSYYAEGLNPVKIIIENTDVRAVRGGTGYAKCGGNYAASMRAGERAEKKGFTQVLWLDGVERKYIEEVGAMNVMFLIGDEVVTPSLTGSVLPGITRKSCLELLKDKGYKVSERLLSVDELIDAVESGKLLEAWGTGTAAVVSPIGQLTYKDKDHIVSNNKIGSLTQELYDELTGIQWGTREDKYNWCVKVKV
ncbi:MAG: branched-chain amino acid aminotransferase [Clostridia bacterium]|nr:branched-chain amino acid aminotransferase [Clostridia bacterium]